MVSEVKKKVLLLFPPVTVTKGSVKKCDMPMGLGYIGAVLEKEGHDVKCIDLSLDGYDTEREHNDKITFGLNDEDIKSRIKVFNPDFIGISCPFSLQLHNVLHVSKLAREVSNARIAVGGVHPTFGTDNLLNNFDSIDIIVMGEGESTIVDLMKDKPLSEIPGISWKNGETIVVNPKRKLIMNLNELPFPARHLFNTDKYIKINLPHNHFPKKKKVGSILTSRGCTGRCTFCSSHLFWGSCIRYRSVENILAEIKELIEKYGVEEIQFLDDNLTGWRDRAMELFEKLKELNIAWCTPNGVRIDTIDEEMLVLMKESGCYRLTYAIESGDEHVLHNIIKKPYDLSKVKPIVDLTKKVGIGLHMFWIIGLPGETKEQMWKTFKFAKVLNSESASFCLATPMVGTELYDLCKDQGILRDGFDVVTANYRVSNIINPDISKKELEELCDTFNTKINQGLFLNNPLGFLRKYGLAVIRDPKRIFNMFRKYG